MRFEFCHSRTLTVTPIGAEIYSIGPARADRQHDLAKASQNPFHAWPLFSAAAVKCRSLVAFTTILAPIILASLSASSAVAQDKKGGGDLGTQATNPASSLIQLQLQDQFIPSTQNASGVANTGIIQPVYPFVLGKDYYFQSIITRTTVPIVTTPDLPSLGRTTGLGDTVFLAAPVHKTPIGNEGEFFTWGPVGATTIPTATEDETGSGKLSLGPGLLGFRNFTKVFNDGDSLLVGGFGYQQWSIAGEGSRQDVSKFFVSPVLVYHFDSLFGQKAWYAGLPDDLWTYDFKKSEFTSIPLGARLGRVFSIGKQPVNAFLQSWYNAADSGADYTIKFNFTLLFPK
jgi:hypothetical protein